MNRYFIKVAYDGTAFNGSQIQGEQPTVQKAVNDALSVFLREPINTLGASRTDEGVHAFGNVYQFDIAQELSAKALYNINAILPETVSVESISKTLKPDANARFDAVRRRYRYRIYFRKNVFLRARAHLFPYTFDEAALHECAALLLQYSDFEAFSKRNAQTKTYQCTLFSSRWERHDNELHYIVEGNRFLRGMVRALVGTQLNVGKGKISIAEFKNIIEAKDCRRADFSVPGYGLYLEEITYPEGYLLPID